MRSTLIEWNVEGMDCTNCAMSITRFLERKGLENVYVNYTTGEVRFDYKKDESIDIETVKKGIHKLGYTIAQEEQEPPFWTLERKLIVSLALAGPMLINHLLMVFGIDVFHFMHNPWVQLGMSLPVFIIGVAHFGSSAWGSLRLGVPNMDVLIFMGSTAAFIYSLVGLVLQEPDYIFFETSATIFALVLLGNYIEKRSVKQTSSAIEELGRLQVKEAQRVMPSGAIVKIPYSDIQKGDRLLVKEGDQVPTDGTILEGSAELNESMLTGESEPVFKQVGESVIGGAINTSGHFRMEATAVGKNTVLQRMIEMVKTAQQEKPGIQRLADKISAIFVPVVIGIALVTFAVSYFLVGIPFSNALLNSIAVLVISCPCAMGLATPTAVSVGVGRMAKNGILIKGAQTLETFAQIRNVVFDKTGTLTTGEFEIEGMQFEQIDPEQGKSIIHQLEQHSSHPIAASLVSRLNASKDASSGTELSDIQEIKGKGMQARDQQGNEWKLGSARILPVSSSNGNHSLYLTKNDQAVGWIDLKDHIKEDVRETIEFFNKHQVHTLILSGDRKEKTQQVAEALSIQEFHAEQLPEEKLRLIEQLSDQAPTAMVGDGINDAPALARATLGVSLSDASSVAIQSAQIVLLKGKFQRLKKAFSISRATLTTIKQNLFWAFAYNVVAIPIAAMGYLNPMWAALFMAFSDVVVIGNSIRLKYKKIKA